MAGNGTRFSQAGYKDIKPLIPIHGKPMVERVADCVGLDGNWIFIVQKDHRELYNLDDELQRIRPNCKIVDTGSGVTEGAACSVLLAKHLINPDAPLIIINSDNIIHWNTAHYFEMLSSNADGLIPCFKDSNPKWSFVKVDNDIVSEVAEKNPISDIATAGIYIWKRGDDFIKSAEQMIEKNIRVNNEFYLCPVYNETITLGKTIKVCFVDEMHGVGTPEDLEIYLSKVPVYK